MEQQNQEDYDAINLYELWQVVIKRKVLIIGLFLITVFLSAIYSFLDPNVYRGQAVFNMLMGKDIITSKEIVDFLGKVDREKQKNILPQTYLPVKKLTITALKDSNNKIAVTIDSKKVNDIPRAMSEVQNYLNNIDIVKINTRQNKEILLKQSAELSELIKLSPDLLATYNKLFNAGKLSTMGFNPVDVRKRIADIKVELLVVEQQLARLNNGCIEIAAKPYISDKPVSKNILRNVILAGVISIILGLFLAFFIEYIGSDKNKGNKQTDKFLTE